MHSSKSASRQGSGGRAFILHNFRAAQGPFGGADSKEGALEGLQLQAEADWREDWRESWANFLGFKADELPEHRPLFAWVAERVDPADRAALRQMWHAFVTGEKTNFDAIFRIRDKDGRWLSARAFSQATMRGNDGRLTHGVGAILDIGETEGAPSHQRLVDAPEPETDAARHRYAAILKDLPCFAFETQIGGMRFTYVNGYAMDLLGYALPRWYEPGFLFNVVVDPADRAMVLQALSGDLAAQNRIEVTFRAITAYGTRRWLKASARLDRDDDDSAPLIRGMFVDVTGSRALEETEKQLMSEIDHRAKNLLAAVQSMALLTYAATTSPEEFVSALVRRIQALARAHDQLAAHRWKGVSLRTLIAGEVEPFDKGSRLRVRMEGEDLILKPRAVQTLSLVLHELAVNAEKHGALSASDGSVRIAWSFFGKEGAQMVRFLWEEAGGPAVARRGPGGFGTLVLERAVAHDLNATGHLEFAPGGVRYRLDVARADLVEDNQNGRGEEYHGAGENSDCRG